MPKRNFTEKEKIVFYGMIKFPGVNDNSLSKIIDINPSTIATIRNKFRKNNYFKLIRIPFLQHCGFELFTISYDRLYFPNLSESPNTILNNIYKRIPNIFYLLSAPDSWFCMGYYQNYLNYRYIHDNIRYNKHQFNLQEDSEKQIIFPFGITKIHNYFDYSQIVANFFDIDNDITEFAHEIQKKQNIAQPTQYELTRSHQENPELNSPLPIHQTNLQFQDQPLKNPDGIKLTKAEREVFLALVQYPELSDFAINKMISISATSINNIRKKFESRSIIRQCVVPNLSLMGFELITLTHLKFKSFGNLKAREKEVNRLLRIIPSILYIASNTDEIILAAYKNFSEYQQINDEITKAYRDNNFLNTEPRTLLFPLSESIMIKEHSYVPIVNQLLGKGTSIINSILEIIGNKLGDTGKEILLKHLESLDILPEELIIKDIPKVIDIIQEIISPIIGDKSTVEITEKIKQLEN